jgi:hypothetical protein
MCHRCTHTGARSMRSQVHAIPRMYTQRHGAASADMCYTAMYGPHLRQLSALASVCGETNIRCKNILLLFSGEREQLADISCSFPHCTCCPVHNLYTQNCTRNPSQSNRHIAAMSYAPLRSQPPAAGDCAIRLPPRQPSARLQRHQAWLHAGPPCALRRPPRAAAVPPAPLAAAAHPAAADAEPQPNLSRTSAGMHAASAPREGCLSHSRGHDAKHSACCGIGSGVGMSRRQLERQGVGLARTYAAAAAQDLQVDEQVADVRGVDAPDAAGLAHVPRLHLHMHNDTETGQTPLEKRRMACALVHGVALVTP